MIEHSWQDGVSYEEDIRRKRGPEGMDLLEKAPPFYLADCFQVRATLRNPIDVRRIVVWRRGNDLPWLSYFSAGRIHSTD